jgi:hypothetical protein
VHLAQTLGEGAQLLTEEGPAAARTCMAAGEAEHRRRVGDVGNDDVLDAIGEVPPPPHPTVATNRL